MLWNVKIPLRKKILLMVVFSLSAIVMIVAVIRVALVAAKGSARDLNWHDWVFFWSNIEMTTSIIIACVASFRQLFVTSSRQRSRVRPSHSWECLSAMPESSVKPRRKCTSKRGSHGKRAVEGDEVTEEAPEPWIRMTDMIPPNGICVDHSISITTSNTGDEDRERMAPYTSIRSNAQV
ncbi:MAG: hypothetical protein LQ345_007248 [Seirophora villosa]|nr:MAG: hypothetical protein LQ345_007248 [Seirophora villosa]